MRAIVVIAVALLVTGCSAGAPAPATDVRDTGATLNGRVFSLQRDTDVQYWFRWGATTAYDHQTPEQTIHIPAAQSNFEAVSAAISGLTRWTTYHYQLCTAPPRPSCLPDDGELTAGPQILFSSTRGGHQNIWSADAGGHHPVRLTDTPPFGADRPAASPDGKTIAFGRYLTGNDAVWLMNRDGTNPHAITDGSSFAYTPSWSPDGKRIAFSDNRGGGDWNIWVMDADGTHQAQVTADAGVDYYPAWSPDGSKIAFAGAHSGSNGPAIYSVDVDGSHETRLSDTTGYAPAWSPDGATITFFRGTPGDLSPNDIWSMDADGSDERNLTGTPAADEAFPAWAPDGSRIAFARSSSDASGIWTMGPDGGHQVRLTREAVDTSPAWLPSP